MPEQKSDLAKAIWGTLQSPNESDQNLEAANVVDGLFAIARGLQAVAKSLDRLGVNDAATPMGAIEMLSWEVRNGLERLAMAREDVG